MPGDQDHRQILIQSTQIGQPFKAALSAQAHVADHDKWHVGPDERASGLDRGESRNGKPRKFESLNAADPNIVVVLDVDHAN